jgi:hypothetical protein
VNAVLDAPSLRPLAQRANLTAGLGLLPSGCSRLVSDHLDALLTAPGSGHNHQCWTGGYADHLDECFAISAALHASLGALRPLEFTLPDALLVMFLHDTAKVFKRVPDELIANRAYAALAAADEHALQDRVCADYAIDLTAEQANALRYVHGELDDYRKDERVAGPLAAFCHAVDYWSARGWHDQPAAGGPLPALIA